MIFVSQNTSNNLKEVLQGLDKVIEIKSLDIVYESINHHPDIFLFCSNEKIYISKEQHELIKDKLEDTLIQIEILEGQLGYRYPQSVRFNAVMMGEYFIHNLKHTTPRILEDMKKLNKKLIHVNQGYTRCCTLPIDSKSIITSDVGIAKVCSSQKIDVCLIQPGFIILPGQSSGFIGGCGGRIKDTMYFTGDITKHPDYKRVKDFIDKRGLKIIYDKTRPLIDLGSILTIGQKTTFYIEKQMN
ncbi:MAG: hypothetical protein GX308_09300 [Epulopiscium sp.]|nr:hypothetical protein [Candidatus Epulonipiscium sp.]